MSRTVTAMFDSRSQAEAARERLTQSRIDADDVRIVDQSASGSSGAESGEGQGLWSAIKAAFIPPEDSHTYEEGMRRGGYLLCARVDEDCADEAIRILDESDSVDLDERENSWRSEGWSPYQSTGGSTGFRQDRQTDRTVAEERIPIVEEELRVGKREVERGGARVRSYVTETPVSQQINLREEHVSVERRPVEGDAAAVWPSERRHVPGPRDRDDRDGRGGRGRQGGPGPRGAGRPQDRRGA